MVTFGVTLISFSACQDPTNSTEATKSNILDETLGVQKLNWKILASQKTFQGKGLFNTDVVFAQNACQGSVGSILPPIALEAGLGMVLSRPLDIAAQAIGVLTDTDQVEEHHIILNGIDRDWVHQDNINDCWAAVLEIARRWHNYQDLSQDQIRAIPQAKCPGFLIQSTGANAYQIAYTIAWMAHTYGDPITDISYCDYEDCILQSLTSGKPVIMLESNHARLIVGVDYRPDMIEGIEVIDPASPSASIERKSPLILANADAFISY